MRRAFRIFLLLALELLLIVVVAAMLYAWWLPVKIGVPVH